MRRISLLCLASLLAAHSFAQVDTPVQAAEVLEIEQGLEAEEGVVEFTELEYQLIESSGLLSLSQQVKMSAQRFIALSLEQPVSSDDKKKVKKAASSKEQKTEVQKVFINHAQHFAIAKNLAKHWTESVWQQRLLELVHELSEEQQQLIQQQLSQPMLQAAQRKEQKAISAQYSPEYRLYMNKLRQRPPSATRWQLVENLDKQSGFSQVIIQARLAVIKQIQQQVSGWQPEEFWQNKARQEVLEFLFYAYRKTPNNDLKRIAQSFNQPELIQFYADVRNAIH